MRGSFSGKSSGWLYDHGYYKAVPALDIVDACKVIFLWVLIFVILAISHRYNTFVCMCELEIVFS